VSPDNTKVRLALEEPEEMFRADIFAGLIFTIQGRKNLKKKNAAFCTGIYIGECMHIGILVIQIYDAEKI